MLRIEAVKLGEFSQILIIAFLGSILVACLGNGSSIEKQNKTIEYEEVRGVLIPKGSSLETQGDELLVYLSKATEIQGYLVRKRKHTNDHCTLDKNGKLIFFVPQDNLSIDSIPCRGQEDVWLYPNGKLFMCHLACNIEHSNQIYREGEFVMIDENGVMKKHSWREFNRIKNSGLFPQNH